MNHTLAKNLARKYAADADPWVLPEYLGGGIHGRAFLLSCGSVLKVGFVVDATADYIHDAALMTRDGCRPSLMPKVYNFGLFTITRPGRVRTCWFAVMERINLDRLSDRYFHPLQHEREEFTDLCVNYQMDDLHSGNWGYAEDGRRVIFDPSADSSQSDLDEVAPLAVPQKAKNLFGCGRGRWQQ